MTSPAGYIDAANFAFVSAMADRRIQSLCLNVHQPGDVFDGVPQAVEGQTRIRQLLVALAIQALGQEG